MRMLKRLKPKKKEESAVKTVFALAVLNLILAVSSFAATYQVNGKEVNLGEAINAASNGKMVTQCQAVVIKPNKAGTSFTFKAPKTPAKMLKED